MLPKRLRSREIDRSAQDFDQSFTLRGELEEIRYVAEFDDNIDVALRPGFIPRYGAKHAQPTHARPDEFRTVSGNTGEEFLACHGRTFVRSIAS